MASSHVCVLLSCYIPEPCKELFFKEILKRKHGRRGASDAKDPDPVTRLFGTAMPSDIPESTEWWRKQQKELFAISDDAELGIMQSMVTITANDGSPELAACIRRGPFAIADENEQLEYMLSRKRSFRAPAERHSVLHVLSYQRRVNAIKNEFFARGCATPLGELRDWWDRTEANCRRKIDADIQTCTLTHDACSNTHLLT